MKTLDQAVQEVVSQHIAQALRATQGNKASAAKLLGVSRRGLYRLMEKYSLKVDLAPPPVACIPNDLPEGALFAGLLNHARRAA